MKRSKARNLLERLLKYEEDVLRFMVEAEVPFEVPPNRWTEIGGS